VSKKYPKYIGILFKKQSNLTNRLASQKYLQSQVLKVPYEGAELPVQSGTKSVKNKGNRNVRVVGLPGNGNFPNES